MTDFWVEEAISILRQNGSREPADAVQALAARLAEAEQVLRDLDANYDLHPKAQAALDAFLRPADSAPAVPCWKCNDTGTVSEAWGSHMQCSRDYPCDCPAGKAKAADSAEAVQENSR